MGMLSSLNDSYLLPGGKVAYDLINLAQLSAPSSSMLGRGSQCYQMTAQECGTQRGLNWDKETGHIALFGWLFYIVTATLDVYERY